MAVLKALLVAAAIIATTQLAAAQTAAERREALSRSIPKHEGYLGAVGAFMKRVPTGFKRRAAEEVVVEEGKAA